MPTGVVTTLDLNVGTMIDMEPMIALLTPFDVPLLSANGVDGRTILAKGNTFEVKSEWMDELLLKARSTVAATATTTATVLTVAAGDGLNFQVGDVLMLGSAGDREGVLVTAYGTTDDTLIITRKYNTASAVALAPGDDVIGTGMALPEGSDAPTARAIDRVERNNITQIFGPTTVSVSATENVVRKFGVSGTEFDKQVGNRFKETQVALEQAVIYGQLFNDTANKKRTMGGFVYYITENVDSDTTTLTESALLDQLETCCDKGGNPDRVLAGLRQKRNISAINSSDIRYGQQENRRGQVVSFYDSDFGVQSIVMDRNVALSDLFIFSRSQATVKTLRPIVFEMLAKTGDSAKGQIVGEKTLMFEADRWAARFSALT